MIASAPSYDDAFKIARLDYPVEKRPCKIVLPDGSLVDSARAFVTMRTDRNIELGTVGKDYTVLQNRDAFDMTMRALVERGDIALETGGVLRDGAQAWLCGVLPLERFGPACQDVFGRELQPFAFVTVDHSGKNANTVALTVIRPVCANTVRMIEHSVDAGRDKGRRVTHTGDVREKMRDAADELFGQFVADAEQAAVAFRSLKNCFLTTEQFEQLVTHAAIGVHPAERKSFNPEARMAEAVVARWERKADAIRNVWHTGKGHTGDDSAWEAYNGVVELVDHDRELFPNRGGVYRTQSLMRGTLRDVKDAVWNSLIGHATNNGLFN